MAHDTRPLKLLSLLVVMVSIISMLSTAVSVGSVRRARRDFDITQERFAYAVNYSVTNFLANYVSQRDSSEDASDPFPRVSLKFVPGLVVYYRPYLARYVCRYQGNDFDVGDFLEDGFIRKISEGRVLVSKGDEFVILRPGMADVSAGPARGRPGRDEDAHL